MQRKRGKRRRGEKQKRKYNLGRGEGRKAGPVQLAALTIGRPALLQAPSEAEQASAAALRERLACSRRHRRLCRCLHPPPWQAAGTRPAQSGPTRSAHPPAPAWQRMRGWQGQQGGEMGTHRWAHGQRLGAGGNQLRFSTATASRDTRPSRPLPIAMHSTPRSTSATAHAPTHLAADKGVASLVSHKL